MCNAYGTIGYSRSAFIHDLLGIPRNFDHDKPRKIVRPTDNVPVIRGASSGFEQISMRWGLIPAWSRQMPDRPLTNARSETVEELRSFSDCFRKRRCILPGDEFYEWARGTKQRVTFRPKQEEFLFAGLWDTWRDGDKIIESCVMLTTTANDIVSPIHDRMPVILLPEQCAHWMDTSISTDELRAMFAPLASDLIELVDESSTTTNQTSLF